MQELSVPIPKASDWWRAGLVGVAYFLVAQVSLEFAIPPGYATPLWPPSGIALAALLLLGRRYWPGIWAGAAFANLLVESAPTIAALIATGNTLEAVVAVTLIRRYIGMTYPLTRGEDVIKFIALCAAAATIPATVALVPLMYRHALSSYELFWNWWTWWLGDTAGIVTVAPLILTWRGRAAMAWSLRKALEAVGLILLLVATIQLIFGARDTAADGYPLTFAIVAFIIWAALRFSQREVALVAALAGALAVWYTVGGRGPFASRPLNEGLLLLQAFVSTIAVTGLVLGAALGERRRTTDALRRRGEELESRAREREQRFELMVASVIDYAIFMLDTRGRVVSWNAGAERITGYTSEEILGKHFACFYPRDDVGRGKPARDLEVAYEQDRYEDEGWRMRKNGSVFWANIVITAVRDQSAKLIGFAKVTRDLTERKLTEIELLGAKAMAERANQAKSEFLARMSHEFRTPLNSLMILAKLLAENVEGNLSPMQVQYAKVIHESGTDLLALINNVLDLSKIESGAIGALHIEQARLAELRESIDRVFRDTAQEKGLQFDITIDERLPRTIEIDLHRVQQILKNLLSNAFKFTPRGSVSLHIALAESGWTPGHTRLDSVRQAVAFSVADTGIGIAESKQEIIFEAFQQADGTSRRQFGGTGLGLSISRELTHILGGEIRLASAVGRGSIFTVYLPLVSHPSREERALQDGALAAQDAAGGSGRG